MNKIEQAAAFGELMGKLAAENLVGDQHKLDVNKNGKIEASDLAALRKGEKPNKEAPKKAN